MAKITGGCQCGAVRFACDSLGRASICHCRMCQKAFGGFYGPLVTVHGLCWTRGAPGYFHSSNVVKRGFCKNCGTLLTFETENMADIAIGAFDEPANIPVVLQVNEQERLPACEAIEHLPVLQGAERHKAQARWQKITSYQHPDYDTSHWTPRHD